MENLSKALMIAGATLIAVMLISLTMWFYNLIRDYNGSINELHNSDENNAFNRYYIYVAQNGSDISGIEACNIFNKVFENNRAYPEYTIKMNGPFKFGNYSFDINMNFNDYNHNMSELTKTENIAQVEELARTTYSYSYSYNDFGRIGSIVLTKK